VLGLLLLSGAADVWGAGDGEDFERAFRAAVLEGDFDMTLHTTRSARFIGNRPGNM
jgi:hypothetical protein